MALRRKTSVGLFWSFIDTVAGQGVNFLVGLILARILSPREFGLISMVTIFISISESFVNSGFKSALIQKKDCSQIDYSTAFYFNIVVGIFFYLILFLISPFVGRFFNESSLEVILKVLGVVVIIDSFIIIQKSILYKRLDFKLQTQISLLSSIVSGSCAIILAINGNGVWSIVYFRLINQILNCGLLWILNKWRPSIVFSWRSFHSLFSFGSRLLVGVIVNAVFNNIYNFVIGKYYSPTELGYYNRANQFKSLPSESLVAIINRVSFPVLSSIQDDSDRLKNVYRQLMGSTAFVSFTLMIGMISIAEPLVLILLGRKWENSVYYLQVLCCAGLFFPLNTLNLNWLQVQGKANKFLKLEFLKYLISIPFVVIGIYMGLKTMLLAMIANSILVFYLYSSQSGGEFGYGFIDQIRDVTSSFIVAVLTALLMFWIGQTNILPIEYLLVIQILSGLVFIILISEIFKVRNYVFIKGLIMYQDF